MWSRIKSSLQQFWSNFIWSSTCKAKTDVGGITLGDSLTSHDGVSPSSIWLTSWEQKCYQKLFIHKIAVLSWLNRALLKPLSIKYRIECKYRIFTTDYISGKQNYGIVMENNNKSRNAHGSGILFLPKTRIAEIMLMWTFPYSSSLNLSFWKY